MSHSTTEVLTGGGVLAVAAGFLIYMAQVGGVLALKTTQDITNPAVYLTGVDKAKFRKPVVPGDQLRIEVEVLKHKKPFWKMQGKVFVESALACEAEMTALVHVEEAESSE